jgi:hypothetical protein
MFYDKTEENLNNRIDKKMICVDILSDTFNYIWYHSGFFKKLDFD